MAKVMTPDDLNEYERLWDEFRPAVSAAHAILVECGVDSQEYLAAEQKLSDIWTRMRSLRGEHDRH